MFFKNRPISNLWFLLAADMVLLAMFFPALAFGVKSGFDIGIHLSWFLSFRDAIDTGQFYPRWLPDQYFGMGSPAMYFYPPFTNYFYTLIDFLTFRAIKEDHLLAVCALLMSALSGVAFFAWIRNFCAARLAMTASLFYALAPYHFLINFYVRGAMAEFAAYIWIPLIFAGIYHVIASGHQRWIFILIASVTGLFFTHLLTAMIIGPAALIYGLYLLYQTKNENLKKAIVLCGAGALGIGMAAVYFISALMLMPYINTDGLRAWPLEDSFLYKAIFDPSKWHYSIFQTFIVAAGYGVISLLILIFRRNFWAVISLIVFAVMNGALPFLFYDPSPFKEMQFAWRFLSLMEFTTITASIIAINRLLLEGKDRLVFLFGFVLLSFCIYFGYLVEKRMHSMRHQVSVMDWTQVEGRFSPLEYFPAGTDFPRGPEQMEERLQPYKDNPAQAWLVKGQGKILHSEWLGDEFLLETESIEPIIVAVHHFYFPSWQAISEDGRSLRLAPVMKDKLLSVEIPPGHYKISLRKVLTIPEKAGFGVSLLCLLLTVLWLFCSVQMRKQGKPETI